MTPEEFLEKGTWKQLAAAMGPCIPLAVVAVIGVSFTGDDWSPVADEVLKTAMTPVSVMAATAIVLFTGAVGSNGDGTENKPSQATTLVSIVYVILTTLYFAASLEALAMPDRSDAKDALTSLSFALLGMVLGSMLAIVVLLALFYQSVDESAANEDSADEAPAP